MVIALYYATTAAEADRIGAAGLQDATTDYGDGVLLAEEPLTCQHVGGSYKYDTTVQVRLDIPQDELAPYAVEEDDGGPRRYLIPTAVVNRRAEVNVLETYEVLAALSDIWQRWPVEDPEDPEGDDPERWVHNMVTREGFLRARVRRGTSVIAEEQGVADRNYLAELMPTKTRLAARRGKVKLT